MNSSIIEAIDKQIAELQHARAILVGAPDVLAQAKRGRGRPKGSKTALKPVATKSKKRTLSEDGRARISAALRKRHAATKKVTKKASSTAEEQAT